MIKEDLDWYYNIDGRIFKQYNLEVSKNNRLYVDTTSIDSTGLYFDEIIFNPNFNFVYGYQLKDSICQTYSINEDYNEIKKEFKIQGINIIYPIFFQESYVYQINEKRNSEGIWADKLYQINLRDGERNEIADLESITDWSEVTDFIFSPDKQKILIQVGTSEAGVWDPEEYLVYDFNNGNSSYIFQEFKENHLGGWYSLPPITNSAYDINGKYVFIKINNPKDKGEFFHVLDSNFNIINKVLSKDYSICGYNYSNRKITSYNVRAILDNMQRVIIPYKLTYTFEKALYALYHNQELSTTLYDSEFRQLDEYQLSILKNMVFARHNYAFDSEFYQAFFNLFDFYNSEEKRKSRTKEINKKLSYHDVQNLKKIRQTLKQVEFEKMYKKQN